MNAWAILIGFLSVLQSTRYFIDPHSLEQQSSVGEALHGWAIAWNIFYCFGGLGMLYGLLRPSRIVDIFGLCAMTAAVLINVLAILFVRPSATGAVLPTLIGVALTATLRIWFLIRNGDFLPRNIVESQPEDYPRIDHARR